MSELNEKTERVVRMLHAENLGGVLLNTQHNFAWLTCGRSNAIDISGENGAGWLFVGRNGQRGLIANNIEISRLSTEEISSDDFALTEVSWQSERNPETVLDAARSLGGSGEIGCDIGFPETRWIEPSIAKCRFELTAPEVERYRDLGRAASDAIDNTISLIAPGQSENEIARIVRDQLGRLEIFSVVTLVAADERIRKYRHPVPTSNVWRNSLLIVVCARRNGLIASLSRMICTVEVPADLQRRTEACASVNAALYAATKQGATGSELFGVAAKAYEARGFADEINKHHQGGACGYRTRDWVAHPESQDKVRINQAFAWNPSITGTKTEETGILTATGVELITSSDRFPTISTRVDGREYLSPGILSISKGVSA